MTPWKDGYGDQVKRVDYEPGGMVSAAPGGLRWFHQHFGVSKEPFRLTAWFGPNAPGREPGPAGEKLIDYNAIDVDQGGTAIPYSHGGSLHPRRIRSDSCERRHREPDGSRVVSARRQNRLGGGMSRMGMSEPVGGRIFFSSAGRTLSVEDQISILTVGVDIGSSTSHLAFSRIVLERLDSRYVVVRERNGLTNLRSCLRRRIANA